MKANWQWIVTAAIAVYGALLSSYNAFVARRQNTRQITVTVNHGFLPTGPELGDPMLLIGAANLGHRAVTLVSVGLLLPDKQQLVLTSPEGTVQLPHHLTEGTSCKHWIPAAEIKRQLSSSRFSGTVMVRGFYLDALGKRHLSELFEIG